VTWDHEGVTAAIINFQTPDLTRLTLTTFKSFYPSIPVLLIDNGSQDESVEVLRELSAKHAMVMPLLNHRNRHHGPAMDQALRLIQTEYALILDSDVRVKKKGFLEGMLDIFRSEPDCYAAGTKIWVNDRGFNVPEGTDAHPYVRPVCMLLRTRLYLELTPFEWHGAPCLANMIAASARHLRLVNYDLEEYIDHEGQGTASRHGYRLGLRGKINHLLNRLGL